MPRDLRTIPDDADIYQTVEILSDIGARRAPVVDDQELEGLLTLDDVLHVVEGELDGTEEVFEQPSPRMDGNGDAGQVSAVRVGRPHC